MPVGINEVREKMGELTAAAERSLSERGKHSYGDIAPAVCLYRGGSGKPGVYLAEPDGEPEIFLRYPPQFPRDAYYVFVGILAEGEEGLEILLAY